MNNVRGVDTRTRALFHLNVLGDTAERTAEVCAVGVRTVRRWQQLFRDVGVLAPRRPPGRPRALSADEVLYIRVLLEERADWQLRELQERLYIATGTLVSQSTLSRTLARMNASRKRLTLVSRQCNALLCTAYLIGMRTLYTADQLVFLDETSKDDRALRRLYGYNYTGRRAESRVPSVRGQRFTATAAIATTGLIAYDVVPGASNTVRLMQYALTYLIPSMNEYPAPRSVLVMDNCAFHHNDDVKAVIQAAGIIIHYLPPYAPHLNPIEEAFSATKHWLRANNAWCAGEDAEWCVHVALTSAITADKCTGWIRHSGYRFEGEQP